MGPYGDDLMAQYAAALENFLAKKEEKDLQRAYELGRSALANSLGVHEMVSIQLGALKRYLDLHPDRTEFPRVVSLAENFFMESLSPFEMVNRGYRESNVTLRRLNEALEREIIQIAHALHDDAGQLLATVYMTLERVAAEIPPNARKPFSEIKEILDRFEGHLRRLSHELRPTILDDLGLLPALEFLAKGISLRTGFPISIEGEIKERFSPLIEAVLYRVVQEALSNISKHAKATRAVVRIRREPYKIRCTIQDNGIGFNLGEKMAEKGTRGLGLIGIQDRLHGLGGTFEVTSDPQSETTLVITIPMEN